MQHLLNIIKNYIFQFSIDKTDEQDFLRKWEDILINTHDIEINQFLMHYWSSVHGEVRKNEIYSRFKNKIKSKRDALIEIENIRLASQIYKNLNDLKLAHMEEYFHIHHSCTQFQKEFPLNVYSFVWYQIFHFCIYLDKFCFIF